MKKFVLEVAALFGVILLSAHEGSMVKPGSAILINPFVGIVFVHWVAMMLLANVWYARGFITATRAAAIATVAPLAILIFTIFAYDYDRIPFTIAIPLDTATLSTAGIALIFLDSGRTKVRLEDRYVIISLFIVFYLSMAGIAVAVLP